MQHDDPEPQLPQRGRSAQPELTPTERLSDLDLSARLGHYQARDAEWARGQPVVIGRDYDFALAMSLGSRVGPVLAATRRKEGNHSIAERLANGERVAGSAIFAALVERCAGGCPLLRGISATLYGVLYGDAEARLRIILEINDEAGVIRQYIVVSRAAKAGDFASTPLLRQSFEDGVVAIAGLLADTQHDAASAGLVVGRCQVGDGSHIEGRVLEHGARGVALELDGSTLAARALCPLEAFSRRAAGGT